jgi:hypothetical protein
MWGFATKAVINYKGYDDNWFWWGFFFGFIAFIVALGKPAGRSSVYDNKTSAMIERAAKEDREAQMLSNDGWKCQCGRVNPSYTGTCVCGGSKIQ